jgi:hypothetical protein
VADNTIDPKFFDQVAQIAHFSFWDNLSTKAWLIGLLLGHPFMALVAVGLCDLWYASWHEFYWDPRHENSATRGSDIRDWKFLMGGWASCCAFTFILWAIGKITGRQIVYGF